MKTRDRRNQCSVFSIQSSRPGNVLKLIAEHCTLNIFRRSFLGCLLVIALADTAHAQRAPHIGYVYPAGGQRATTFEVVVGGQGLDSPTGVVISGEGVTVEILEHDKPLSAVAAGDVRDKLREMQPKLRALRNDPATTPATLLPGIRKLLREAELTEKELRLMADYDRRRNDPKQQQNAQIGETVRMKVTIAETAELGMRFWRLRTAGGLSNPMRFMVGQHEEIREAEPPPEFDLDRYSASSNTRKSAITPAFSLPATVNGHILPGEVDQFTFHAKKGQQVVLDVDARSLIPYLADAVPGWFQAVVAVFDSSGNEVAFAGSYRFDPDPVVFYKIPEDGDYRIEVHDSIYRGREDFVYRITLGELPFLTGISPLGATAGSKVNLTFQGGNLGENFRQKYTAPDEAGIVYLHATNGKWRSNSIPFQVDTLAEEPEHEPNNSFGAACEIKPPTIVNGRIDARGDADYFRLKGRGNKEMVFEIFARRLGSPMDSSLAVFDTAGKQIGFNDDHEDPASGLTTHHADSRLSVKLPATGECFVRVTDTQNQGGVGLVYRLKATQAQPSFALRITPASVNANVGGAARLTVHVLRTDGFDGEIALKLKGTNEYFQLKNAKIPAGQDHADISLTVPSTPTADPVAISLEGSSEVEGKTIVADAIPAEDMMQAFIYRHLVPVDALLVDVRPPAEKAKAEK